MADAGNSAALSSRPAETRRVRKSKSAFRTISEVAGTLDVPQHVLRFWETKFSQVRPMKRGGGRRYYRPEDIDLLRSIRNLLYDEGYTIKGVQKLLRDGGVRSVREGGDDPVPSAPKRPTPVGETGLSATQAREVRGLLDDLTELRDRLRGLAR
ncbi:MAG: MerR family transcriptional regulator [Rhodospirillaceae bacterium]|jgi:DNA-binding transcriptional MerR regulator|nr:MerR family transcriptional regulator [Rhodospirillaceae bacterium]